MALLKNNYVPDRPIPYPKSLAEAKKIIEQTFTENTWNEADQTRYFRGLGVTETTNALSLTETRKVITDFIRSRMIICK